MVLGLPDGVLSALRGSAAAALYQDSLNRAVQDLQAGGFQRLTLLQLPDAQVPCPPHSNPSWMHLHLVAGSISPPSTWLCGHCHP